MLYKAKRLQEASLQAKELIVKLNQKSPVQWNYKLIEQDIKQTYKALKRAWTNGEDLDSVQEYLSEEGYKLLSSDSKIGNADLKYLDLLDCFDSELEDFLIISVINLPEAAEDYIVVWLDNEYSSEEANIEQIEGDKLNSFGLFDNLSSGLNIWNIFKIASNDCWTFKWSNQQEKWVLHNIALDKSTSGYLQVLGKNFNCE